MKDKTLFLLLAAFLLPSCSNTRPSSTYNPATPASSSTVVSKTTSQSQSKSEKNVDPKDIQIGSSPIASLVSFVSINGTTFYTEYDTYNDDWGAWDRGRKAANQSLVFGAISYIHKNAYVAYNKSGIDVGRSESLEIKSTNSNITAIYRPSKRGILEIVSGSLSISSSTKIYVDVFHGDDFYGGYYSNPASDSIMEKICGNDIPRFFEDLKQSMINTFGQSLITESDFGQERGSPRWSVDVPYGKTARDFLPWYKLTIHLGNQERKYSVYSLSGENGSPKHSLGHSEKLEIDFAKGDSITFYGEYLFGTYQRSSGPHWLPDKDCQYAFDCSTGSFSQITNLDNNAVLLAQYIKNNANSNNRISRGLGAGWNQFNAYIERKDNDYTFAIGCDFSSAYYSFGSENTTFEQTFRYGQFKSYSGDVSVGTKQSYQTIDFRYHFSVRWKELLVCPNATFEVTGPSGGNPDSTRVPRVSEVTTLCQQYLPPLLEFAQSICKSAGASVTLW